MSVWDSLLEKNFSELYKLTFQEVVEVINRNLYFVVDEEASKRLISKAQPIKDEYLAERKKIEEYQANVYNPSVDRGIYLPADPCFMYGKLETETKDKLIEVVIEFFDVATFKKYKDDTFDVAPPEGPSQDINGLAKVLMTMRKWTYQFITMVDWWHRHEGYFLSWPDMYGVCCRYSKEVVVINRKAGLGFQFINLFQPWTRLDKLSEDYIDIDDISLQSLVLPCFKENVDQLIVIAETIKKAFRGSHGKRAWDEAIKSVSKYIKECEAKGIMKKVN